MVGILAVMVFVAVILFGSRKTYSYSSILPIKTRRSWIRWKYREDFEKWPMYEETLKLYFPYYKILGPTDQIEFMVRTTDFMNRTNFEGREGVEIDDRKRLLLGASMAQLTFGFNHFRFYGFEKIILYPHIFYSKYLDADVKGITYGTGYIFLSWQDFEDGYEDASDKLNLGLHEFAHALKLERPGHFEAETFDVFLQMGNYLMKQKNQTGESDPLFRDYGLSNHNELWAVCVEVFFERPADFQDTYPNLYKVMTKLLHQDTLSMQKTYQSGAYISP